MDFSCDPIKCLICSNKFPYSNGYFVSHLKKEHNMSLRDYVVKYDYNNDENKIPKCQCGYCNEPVPFWRGKFLEGQKLRKHQNHKWQKEQYIKKYGISKCYCGNNITTFNRGKPIKHCDKCVKDKKIYLDNTGIFKKGVLSGREGMLKKYGVDSYSKLDHVRKQYSKRMKENNPMSNLDIAKKAGNTQKLRIQSGEIVPYGGIKRKNAILKAKETKRKRYKNGCFDNEKMKKAIFEKYGVEHISQLEENRKKSSERMIAYNSDWKNHYNTKKYKNTSLYYQSSYEYEFLELCEDNGILHRIKNGNFYNYLNEDRGCGIRHITDFYLDDKFEIEIKSSYILKKQGGIQKVFAKKRAVEESGKRYIFILDKDYLEFLSLI